jgi:hypothetical protein
MVTEIAHARQIVQRSSLPDCRPMFGRATAATQGQDTVVRSDPNALNMGSMNMIAILVDTSDLKLHLILDARIAGMVASMKEEALTIDLSPLKKEIVRQSVLRPVNVSERFVKPVQDQDLRQLWNLHGWNHKLLPEKRPHQNPPSTLHGRR